MGNFSEQVWGLSGERHQEPGDGADTPADPETPDDPEQPVDPDQPVQ